MALAHQTSLALLVLAGCCVSARGAEAQIPDPIAAPGETVVLALHAEGMQVYDCKAGADGSFAWVFREPVATLSLDGNTVGRHSAGPNWEHSDGSAVVGKAVANAPGATPKDIPWLKLEVTSQRGGGILSGVTTVQRVNTHGGKPDASCDRAGIVQNVPYSAEYIFLRKG